MKLFLDTAHHYRTDMSGGYAMDLGLDLPKVVQPPPAAVAATDICCCMFLLVVAVSPVDGFRCLINMKWHRIDVLSGVQSESNFAFK